MIVRRFETKEVYDGRDTNHKARKLPLFLEPKFFFGLEAVKEDLFLHVNDHRYCVLVELADLAKTLPGYLAASPTIGRGRPLRPDRRHT